MFIYVLKVYIDGYTYVVCINGLYSIYKEVLKAYLIKDDTFNYYQMTVSFLSAGS